MLILKDISGWEIQCIIDFMYKGETSVPEAQLNSLMKASESLRIQGLTNNEEQLFHQSVRQDSKESNLIECDSGEGYGGESYSSRGRGRGPGEALLAKDPLTKLAQMVS